MNRYSIISHKGKEIFYVDYRDLDAADIVKTMDEATEFALKENRPLLRLSNMTGTFAVKEVVKKANESGKRTKHLTIKRAAVGIVGAKKILFNAFNKFTENDARAFDTEEEAKEWLVQ